jgi:hypothetical protein
MKRGRARVYTYQMGPFSPKPYPKTISKDERMALPGAEFCEFKSCLMCPYSGVSQNVWKIRARWEELNVPLCQTIRAKYERKKKFFLTEMADIANEKRREAMVKKTQLADIVVTLREHVGMLRKTKRNRIDLDSATSVIRQFLGSGVTDTSVKKACRELDVDTDLIDEVEMLSYSVKT